MTHTGGYRISRAKMRSLLHCFSSHHFWNLAAERWPRNDGWRQLEELEDKDVMETSVVLEPAGIVAAGTTNGPLPMSSEGTWTYDGKVFSMVREQHKNILSGREGFVIGA